MAASSRSICQSVVRTALNSLGNIEFSTGARSIAADIHRVPPIIARFRVPFEGISPVFLPIFHPPIFQLHDEIIGDLERGRTIPKLPGYIFRDAFVLNRRVKLNFLKLKRTGIVGKSCCHATSCEVKIDRRRVRGSNSLL